MNKYLFIIALAFLSTSCIDTGLDELPLNDASAITSFNFEYRFSIKNANGFDQLEYKTMNTNTTITGTNIDCVITIPAPSGVFTAAIAAQVKLTNIVGYCDISDAATLEPVSGSPVLGKVGDFSQPRSYKVTAANGTSTTYTLTARMAQ